MRQKKLPSRLLAMLLSLMLVIGMFPTTAFAIGTADDVDLPEEKFATAEQLRAFNTNDTDGSTSAAKVYLGENGQQWWIAGSQDGDSLVLFSASSLSNEVFQGDTQDQEYEGESVYANHYGASQIRTKLNNELVYSLFNASENTLLMPSTIYTEDAKNGTVYALSDELYLGYATYTKTDFYVGENSTDSLESGLRVDSRYLGEDIFWLRNPYSDFGGFVFVSVFWPDLGVNYYNTYMALSVYPAVKINLSTVLFGSAAPAAAADGALALADTDGAGAFTLRYASDRLGTAEISYDKTSVNFSDVPEGTYLVVQDSTGAYAKTVSGSGSVTASDMSVTSFENCKVWLEKTTDRMSYAAMATQGTISAVTYLDENGDELTLTDAYTTVTSGITSWSGGWYVVDGNVIIDSRVTVTGDVKLILKEEANLTVNGGIDVSGTSNSFTVYAQSADESQMGSLTATAADGTGNAGIGSSGGQTAGAITIHGGKVTATGGSRSETDFLPGAPSPEDKVYTGAGIGGGEKSACSMITINGGIVTANPGQGSDFWETSNSAAIGNGGQNRMDMWYDETPVGIIVINGGSVNATGVWWGAGIGGGDEMPIASITINGGIVRAESDSSAGIGNGGAGDGGTITITGGTINAVSESACGIGGGYISDIEKVVITGGDITATSDRGAGIGSCAYQTTAQVTISGGIVTATSNKGDGIGMGDIFRNDLVDFSTGTNGDAVIFASSIADQTGKDSWNGLIFVDNNGKIYGDSYTVEDGLTIPSDKILTIENGKTMIIPDGVTFDFAGEIRLDEGGKYTGTLPSGVKVTYQIQWDTDGDGTVDDTTYVAYGAMPAHADGSKESDPQYTYTFTGWDPSLAEVTGPAKYTATFEPSLNQYTVTLPSGKGYTVTASGSTTVNYDTEFTFTVTVENGYSKTDGFAVKANGTKLTEQSGGSYKVTVKSNTDITVEGVEDTTAPSNLTVSYETNSFREFLNTATFGLFFKDTVNVTISATDAGSGVKEISYQLGDGSLQTVETQNGSISFTVEPEFKGNIHNVTATDNAGNTTEGIDYEYFAVEKNKPADVTVDTNGYESGKWTNEDVTITVSGSTATSGIAKYQYSTDGGQSWHDMTATEKTEATTTEPLNVTEAQLVVSNNGTADYIFRAVSNAGNESTSTESVTVKIDQVEPTIAATGDTGSYLTSDTIIITANVGESGITSVEVQTGSDRWTDITDSYSSGYAVTANGTYTFRVTNGAGVTASTSITYDKLDSVKPVVSVDSGEYISGNWTNKNITLSVSNAAANLGTTTFQYKVENGEWQTYTDSITVSEETAGTTYTFKAVSASGVESDEALITVKLDKTAPDGDIKIQENSVKQLLNQITFGLFFNENVDVTISGTDALSGVASIQFYRSQDILAQAEVEAISDWQDYTSITETAVDAEKFIYYARITDEAGNATIVGSDGVVFDLTAPAITGVTNGGTYYTTQSVTVADANLATVTVNGVADHETLTLGGNVDQTYTIVATDKAGNSTTLTVTMKPIENLTAPIAALTLDNVTSADKNAVEAVKEQVASIDMEDATQEEKATVQEMVSKCDTLMGKIEEIAQTLANLEQALQAYDVATVTSSDKEAIQQLKTSLQNLTNSGNLTEEEKAQVQEMVSKCDTLMGKIQEIAQTLANLEQALQAYDVATVTSSDKEAIQQLKTSLQNLANSGNLTEEEKAQVQEMVSECDTLMGKIEEIAQTLANLEQALQTYDVATVTSSDKEAIQQLKDSLQNLTNSGNLTEEEKTQVQEMESECDTLMGKIQEIAQTMANLEQALQAYDVATVTSSDKEAIQQLNDSLQNLLNSGNLTQEEKARVQEMVGQCDTLMGKIQEIAQTMANLEQALQAYDVATVTSSDKEAIQQLNDSLQNLLNSGNLTQEEKARVQEMVGQCDTLLDAIAAAGSAGTTENTDKVEEITSDNVSLEDKEDLTTAKEDLENALENFGDNYTEEEKAELEEKLEQINNALESIEKVEAVQDVIAALPDTVEPDDTDAETWINAAKEQYDQLTEHEKSLIPEELKAKLESLLGDLGDYRILVGNGIQWTIGDNTSISITANGSVEKFVGLQVDGKAVDAANYTVKSGSTIITLKPEYLNTLSVGQHTLTITYTDGQVSCEFEVLKRAETATPGTRDNNNVVLWTSLLLLAACALAGTTAYTYKKKHSK